VEAQDPLVDPVGAGGLQQFLAAQRLEHAVEVGLDLPGDELVEGTAVHLWADHRRPLQHGSFLGAEAVKPRRQQRVDRRRHVDGRGVHGERPDAVDTPEHAIVDEHPHELAHEERVAVARGTQSREKGSRHLVGRQQLARQVIGGFAVEALEWKEDSGAVRLGERGSDLSQLRPRHDDKQDGLGEPLRQMLDEIEEERLGPVHVFEHGEDRLAPSRQLDDPPYRPERLLGCGRRPGTCKALGHLHEPLVIGIAGRDTVEAGDQFGHRGERRRTRRGTHAAENDGLVAETGAQLPDETGLADAGRSDHRRQTRSLVLDHVVEQRPKGAQLAGAADERCCC
jgi:hypothetical protein